MLALGHSSIDYSFVREKLIELRKKSMHYLTNALIASAYLETNQELTV